MVRPMARPVGGDSIRRGVSDDVEEKLRQLIGDELRPGERLPSERDLSARLGVSRPTLREVISSMSRTGELDRQWGIGTFVPASTRKFHFHLGGDVRPLRLIALNQGFKADLIDFKTELVLADDRTGETLGVTSGSFVWSVERTLELDRRPVVHMSDFVRTEINGREIDLSALGKEGHLDLLTHIQEVANIKIDYLDLILGVDLTTAEFARRFRIEPGSPLLVSRFVGRADTGMPLSSGSLHYVPGRVELILNGIGTTSARASEY